MAADGSSKSSSPRTVADATRFTSNTPHANAKSIKASPGSPSASTSTGNPTPKSPTQSASPLTKKMANPKARAAGAVRNETMEQRVKRLRAAHLAARQHDVSYFDRALNTSRPIFDAAHKFTVAALIGLSGLALFVTIYATADMAIYNRKRRNEFFDLQKQFSENSLEAARLAYMTGKATEEQIAQVEEATAQAQKAGVPLPPLLSAAESATAPGERDLANSPTGLEGLSPVETSDGAKPEGEKKKGGGVTGWLFGGLKKEEARDDDEAYLASIRQQPQAAASQLKDKASAAFEQERENQRRGGPLDQLGTQQQQPPAPQAGETKKKGWLW